MSRLLIALIFFGFLTFQGSAQELTVRGTYSGLWFSPQQAGHGLEVEVLGPREVVVTWYVYDGSGNPFWLIGTGTIDGAVLNVPLMSFQGGSFPPTFDPDSVVGQDWGDMVMTFSDCDAALLEWTPEQAGFEEGSLELVRLTNIDGLDCGVAETFEQIIQFSLDAGPGRWQPLFADYGQAQSESIETEAGWVRVPEPLNHRDGFQLSGRNTSDDLAMFLTTPIGGLVPDTVYDLELEMTFATEVPQDCAGIGGSPGESVYVKLGASTLEPVVISEGDDFSLSIDKGNQSQGGSQALVVGDMTNEFEDCTDTSHWQLKTVSTSNSSFSARSDESGRIWVYGGTDSGFEGRTTWYVTDFIVRLARGEG